MQRVFLLLLLGLILSACEDPSEPGGSDNPSSTTVTVKQVTDLPKTGGNVTSMVLNQDNSIVAVIDGKLYGVNSSSGSMQLINGDATHQTVAVAPSGELYALTDTEIRTYNSTTGTYRSVPVDPNGPLAIGRRIERSEIRFSPAGEPYVKIINNTPQTYVYYSTDKGETWTPLSLPQGFQYDGGFAFAANGDLLMSNTYGFYRSSDRGSTWSSSSPPRPGYGGKLLVASNGDIYHYPPGGGGLKVSRDGGSSFTELTPFNSDPFFVDITQGSDQALYGLAGRRLLRSTDGGATWNHVVFGPGTVLAMRGSTIAVGLGSSSSTGGRGGGIMISRDKGSIWTSTGTKSVERITDIGLDRDGNLMILADAGLYRRVNGEWRTLGNNPGAFGRFAVTPQGALVLASVTEVYYSSDNGATWKYNPITDFIGGIDPMVIPVLLGRRNGEFILSLATYSDARLYGNGRLYRIGGDGVPVLVQGLGNTFSSMVEDGDGILYASEQYLTFGHTIGTRRYQSSNGTIWNDVSNMGLPVRVGIAYNSRNRALIVASDVYKPFKLQGAGEDQETELKLEGFSSEPHYVRRAMFGPDDRLYLMTLTNQIFISDNPVR